MATKQVTVLGESIVISPLSLAIGLITNPQCPMPNAQCPMPHAQCPITND
ncbi:hypothetical protein [Nostoc sp. UHCC 0251]|nr:hypothetical protein [Nostoc sp. UHCC 0251]MEA5625384.1 hypothetical protein [Nostoc sp. UHCC 0251]